MNKNEKNISDIAPTLNTDIYRSVEIDDPLILEFFRALKNQKLFGNFSFWNSFLRIKPKNRLEILLSHDSINVGNLTIIPDNSDLMKRLKIIRATIVSKDNGQKIKLSNYDASHYLGAYVREYFKNKKISAKHSQIYYQFIFGIINVLIEMFLIFGIVYYLWGKTVLCVVLIFLLFYCSIGIYMLYIRFLCTKT